MVTEVRLRLMGVWAMFSYTLDLGEHARRLQCGGGALLSPDVLELLLGLPVGMPVPVESLTDREWGALADAPPWAVRVADGQAVRAAVPPLSVTLAVVNAKSWRSGLTAAGRFTPFCARALVLEARPPDAQEAQMQADFFGVGLSIACGDHVELLVEPGPWRQIRSTAAGWRFRELVYDSVARRMQSSAGLPS